MNHTISLHSQKNSDSRTFFAFCIEDSRVLEIFKANFRLPVGVPFTEKLATRLRYTKYTETRRDYYRKSVFILT